MISNKKVGIISQARMTSTRLPGKILMEVKGKPMLEYQVDRLKWSGIPLYIATTTNQTDDIVVRFAKDHDIIFSRGSEDNVLSRYYQCAKENELDIIIRVTSDCPLIDGNLIKQGLNIYFEADDENLYVSNCVDRTFPRGFDYEIFSFKLLEDAFRNADKSLELEHVTPYIKTNRSGKVNLRNIINRTDYSNLRITVDTIDDFELVHCLIEEYNADQLGYDKIIEILLQHPQLAAINAHVEQKKGLRGMVFR